MSGLVGLGPVGKEWVITCADLAGRPCSVTVFADRGHVVLLAPPGETAIFTPQQVRSLRTAMTRAIVEGSTPE